MTNKHGNIETFYNGYHFASGVEKLRYMELRLWEYNGGISGLEMQPVLVLQPGFTYRGKRIKQITYRADFKYIEHRPALDEPDLIVIEDVKGKTAPLTEAFNIKWKIAKRLNPEFDFRIVRM